MNEKKQTILIVEDEASYRHTLSEKLNMEGFETLVASDGWEGLFVAKEKHPDLILLDLKMPKMDGMQMAKSLRQDDWWKTAKIMILTNFPDLNQVKEAVEVEIFQYIIKSDIKLETLVQKIRDVIKG